MKVIEVDETSHLCLFALIDLVPGVELRYSYGDGDFFWRTFKVRMYCFLRTETVLSFLHKVQTTVKMCCA